MLTNKTNKLTIRCTLPWSQPHPLFSEIRASNFSDLVYKPDPGGAGILQKIVSCTFHSIWREVSTLLPGKDKTWSWSLSPSSTSSIRQRCLWRSARPLKSESDYPGKGKATKQMLWHCEVYLSNYRASCFMKVVTQFFRSYVWRRILNLHIYFINNFLFSLY